MFLRCKNTKEKTKKDRDIQQQIEYSDEIWKDIQDYENEY